jgi:L-ascorbate metabolism protein UlaG (beta-lactamase superfamily)
MTSKRTRFRRETQIAVEYDDCTEFGSPVDGGKRIEAWVAELYAPVIEVARADGYAELHKRAPELLSQIVRGDGFSRIADSQAAGAWRLKSSVLFPDARLASPKSITLLCQENGRLVRAELPEGHWPLVHEMIAGLATRDGLDLAESSFGPDMRSLLGALDGNNLIERVEGTTDIDPTLDCADFTFVGHNTVVARSPVTRIIIDPLFFAGGSSFPESYQPLQLRDLDPIHAVLITHSHPDHFDPASLLRFSRQTHLIVPWIERESILSIAMEYRLRELGFTSVTSMRWGDEVLVGDIQVHALPLYGEQPTDGEVLHSDVRNVGNTYLLRAPNFSAVFLADSGRDLQGDAKTLATQTRARLGAVDVVFAGYRGWYTYPVQLLFSPVARYLLFVPPCLWSSRLQLMTNIEEAVDVAERWGARILVPYADGGAPWYWNSGLGPNLHDPKSEVSWLDPFPQKVAAAASNRIEMPDKSIISSSVRTMLLHPGESIVDTRVKADKLLISHCRWPYEES